MGATFPAREEWDELLWRLAEERTPLDESKAAAAFDRLRRKLEMICRARGCLAFEECAAEALARVATKLIRDVPAFAKTFARNVGRECHRAEERRHAHEEPQ